VANASLTGEKKDQSKEKWGGKVHADDSGWWEVKDIVRRGRGEWNEMSTENQDAMEWH